MTRGSFSRSPNGHVTVSWSRVSKPDTCNCLTENAGHCRRMTSQSLILVILYMLAMPLMTSSSPAQFIEGSPAGCDDEGQEVFVPGISVDPCISCVCRLGEIHCSKKTCPDNEGCHVVMHAKPDDTCCDTCHGCQRANRTYLSGTNWLDDRDPCRMTTCHGGVLTTSLIRCHATCKNPRLLPGRCCPLCQGCYINGVFYREGQIFPSPRDPCAVCSCENGTTTCSKSPCPVPNCPSQYQYTPIGSCCPLCQGSRKVFLPPGGRCFFQGGVYAEGDVITVDECTECQCKGGTVICSRKSCAILDCAANNTYTPEGACCPRCRLPKRKCKLFGQKHPHDSVWRMDVCTACICDDGTSRCQSQACDNRLECPTNTRLKMIPGQCCPECVDDGAVCTVFGDPHYRTYDGSVYNFQGVCDYLLTRTCESGELSVTVRNDARLTNDYAWTKSVKIRLGSSKIHFLQKNRVKVNKKRVRLPYLHKAGQFSIVSVDRSVALKTTLGVKVTWDGNSYLEVYVPPSLKGAMCGMCGNYNNDRADDFVGRDGVPHLDVDEFAQTWGVGRRCFGGNHLPENNGRRQPCEGDPLWKDQSEQLCQVFYRADWKHCPAIKDVNAYYKSCVTDMCECRDGTSCLCDSLKAFVSACAKDGVDVQEHLPEACKEQNCPKGARWSQCASPCPRTCDRWRPCNEPCSPGCECPSDKVLHKNHCVAPLRCLLLKPKRKKLKENMLLSINNTAMTPDNRNSADARRR